MASRKDFCLFYGEILQKIVIYELHLQQLDFTLENLESSSINNKIIELYTGNLEPLFTTDKRRAMNDSDQDPEPRGKYREACFGHIEVTGHLFIKQQITLKTILEVFKCLLGYSNIKNYEVDDMVIECAVILMYKVGPYLMRVCNELDEEQKYGTVMAKFSMILRK